MIPIDAHPALVLRHSSNEEKGEKLTKMKAELESILSQDSHQVHIDELIARIKTMLMLGDACRMAHPALYEEFHAKLMEVDHRFLRAIEAS
jgi:hypothetical protein